MREIYFSHILWRNSYQLLSRGGITTSDILLRGEIAVSCFIWVNHWPSRCEITTSDLLLVKYLSVTFMCVMIYEIGYLNIWHDEISQIWDFLEYPICDYLTILKNSWNETSPLVRPRVPPTAYRHFMHVFLFNSLPDLQHIQVSWAKKLTNWSCFV